MAHNLFEIADVKKWVHRQVDNILQDKQPL